MKNLHIPIRWKCLAAVSFMAMLPESIISPVADLKARARSTLLKYLAAKTRATEVIVTASRTLMTSTSPILKVLKKAKSWIIPQKETTQACILRLRLFVAILDNAGLRRIGVVS